MKFSGSMAIGLAGLMLILIVTTPAAFAVPTTVNYQGYLTDDSGVPVSGTVSITFRIYDAETDGTLKWNETQDVDVNNGVYSVQLGSGGNPLNESVFTGEARYLEVEIDGTPLSPRLPFTSNAYAIRAGVANSVASSAVSTEMVADGAITAAKISVPLTLTGSQTLATLAGSTYGVFGQHASSGSIGYLGYGTYGVYGYHSTDKGVYGNSGNGTGVYGNSISGYGVYGQAPTGVYGYGSIVNGTGVYGFSTGDESYGVYGTSAFGGYGVFGSSTDGTGVYGIGERGVSGVGAVNGTGVSGSSFGETGIGVYGGCDAGTGVFGKGIKGLHGYGLVNGTGVYGTSSGESGYGVYGENDDGVGVHGKGVNGVLGSGIVNAVGVYGYSLGSEGKGVVGFNTAGGHAGFFIGDVAADSYQYRSTQTHYENVSPAEFVQLRSYTSDDIWHADRDEGYISGNSGAAAAYANAPVHLPEGATVTELKCGFLDNDASQDIEVDVMLYRNDPFSTTSENMAQLFWATASTYSASVVTEVDDTINNATIDNSSYSYTLRLEMYTSGASSAMAFKGCRIAYTVDTVAP